MRQKVIIRFAAFHWRAAARAIKPEQLRRGNTMGRTIRAGEQIEMVNDGKTELYIYNGITFPTYGLAFRAALADMKARTIKQTTDH
jgi:hypothetical protein